LGNLETDIEKMAKKAAPTREDLRQRLIDIGIALSAERDHDRLLERILLEAKAICNADGGTLYLREDDETLRFAIMHNDSLGIALGGTTGEAIPYEPLRLHDAETGEPNVSNVATYVALKGVTVGIPDAYGAEAFDFSGTKAYDEQMGYRSASFLTVPLKNTQDQIIGVLQLINAKDTTTGEVVPFPEVLQPIAEALGSQAAVAIDNHNLIAAQEELLDSFRKLVEIGIALSAEQNFNRLLEQILLRAKAFCHADGGTLYLRRQDDALDFAIVHNDSLGIAMGGTTGEEITYDPLPLYDADDKPNLHNVATYVVHSGVMVNVPDAYSAKNFDFSGTMAFDERTGYRSTSFLTVPLKNHESEIIGVLQLINALDPKTGAVIPFPEAMQPSVAALSSQAAIAIDNQNLLAQQKHLLESFIRLIARAIDLKSPYTGGHCQRVPAITEMLARAACEAEDGPYQDFDLDEDEKYELHIAAWLHDCGKVTTPEYVVDKATKLETIYDRIETVKTRFEVLKRDAEIDYLKALAREDADADALKHELDARLVEIEDDTRFIEEANIGGEFMAEDKIERVNAIAKQRWRHWDGEDRNFLSEDEVYNLHIARGTLTSEERTVINDHIVATIDMLEQLPFPKNLARVPEYAGGHHEKMDGTGYPRGLTADQMSIPARMMAIADIYEALTASDRPYKSAKTLSESVRIMSFMKKDAHIDGDLFDLFLKSGVYRAYAEEHLRPEQIDEVDIDAYVESGSASGAAD
jgi:HD-GYP domain-containing protein (c-di-GMP phosphodiesterase class II)